jgi:hypothetical protein
LLLFRFRLHFLLLLLRFRFDSHSYSFGFGFIPHCYAFAFDLIPHCYSFGWRIYYVSKKPRGYYSGFRVATMLRAPPQVECKEAPSLLQLWATTSFLPSRPTGPLLEQRYFVTVWAACSVSSVFLLVSDLGLRGRVIARGHCNTFEIKSKFVVGSTRRRRSRCKRGPSSNIRRISAYTSNILSCSISSQVGLTSGVKSLSRYPWLFTVSD